MLLNIKLCVVQNIVNLSKVLFLVHKSFFNVDNLISNVLVKVLKSIYNVFILEGYQRILENFEAKEFMRVYVKTYYCYWHNFHSED